MPVVGCWLQSVNYLIYMESDSFTFPSFGYSLIHLVNYLLIVYLPLTGGLNAWHIPQMNHCGHMALQQFKNSADAGALTKNN